MTTIHKRIEIKAPLSEVYAYIEYPVHGSDWLPSIMEVEDSLFSRIRTYYQWVQEKLGMVQGEAPLAGDNPGQRMTLKNNWKLVKAHSWSYNLITDGDTTVLSFILEYPMPRYIRGTRTEEIILNYNEVETDLCLMNIKKGLEDTKASSVSSVAEENLVEATRDGVGVELRDAFVAHGKHGHDRFDERLVSERLVPCEVA